MDSVLLHILEVEVLSPPAGWRLDSGVAYVVYVGACEGNMLIA